MKAIIILSVMLSGCVLYTNSLRSEDKYCVERCYKKYRNDISSAYWNDKYQMCRCVFKNKPIENGD